MSVYKNGDGRWMVDVTIQRPDGTTKRVRKVSPVQNQRGALKYEVELREQLWTTKEKPRESPTLGDWAEQFVAEHSIPSGLRESTIREQRRSYRLYILPVLGASTRLTDVGQAQMHKLRAAMAAKGLSSKTINNALGVLVKSLAHYYDSREIPRPNLRPPRAKVPKSPPKFWEPANYEALVRAAADLGPQVMAAVLLMGDAGLRAGEVIALEWSHIRWGREPALVVQRSYTDGNFTVPKGGRPRTVPLTARAASALQALPRSISVQWVLPHEARTHMEIHHLHQIVGNAERKSKLGAPKKRGQLHKLRHTYATRLVASGVDLRTIQELMGHAQIATTEKYMHLVAGAGSRAVAQLEQFDSRQDGGSHPGGRTKKTS